MGAKLFGIKIDDYDFAEALKAAEALIVSDKVSQIVTINPEMFTCAENDKNFAKIIDEAEMVIPDGVGVKIALKITGQKAERIPGIDFAKKLIEYSSEKNIPIALVGAKEEILQKTVENLKKEFPELNIVYAHNGYFENPDEIYQGIKNTSPKLILAALGSPKQEEFIYNSKKIINPALLIGVGGSFDVWSGCVKRAPKMFQKLGLEWLYRTVTQPERFKRIFPALPLFLLKVLLYKDNKDKRC